MVRYVGNCPFDPLWYVRPFMVLKIVYGPLDRLWSVRSFMACKIVNGPLDRL
jgi:hypothetical protein